MYFYTRNSLVYAVSLISSDFQRYRYFSISGYRKKEGKNASWKLILRKSKKHFFLFIREEKMHVLYTRICILNCRIDWNRSQTLKLRFQKVICEKRFWRNKSCPKMKKSCRKIKTSFSRLKIYLTRCIFTRGIHWYTQFSLSLLIFKDIDIFRFGDNEKKKGKTRVEN